MVAGTEPESTSIAPCRLAACVELRTKRACERQRTQAHGEPDRGLRAPGGSEAGPVRSATPLPPLGAGASHRAEAECEPGWGGPWLNSIAWGHLVLR
jgi:hypothetical protein